MKNKFVLLLLTGSLLGLAQTKGKITYRIETIKDSIEEPYANPENTQIQNDVLEMLHESQPVEGYLIFNDSISIYKAEPKVDIPGWNNSNGNLMITTSGINVTWFMAGGNSTFYSDWSRNFVISQNNIMGPTKRIIRDSINWTITKKTKEIDGYICCLATLDKSKGDKKLKVWYAPDIPVKHGPAAYNGLPGLILEIEDVRLLWTVVKIDFNNIEADNIIEPTEGELMTQEEFKKFSGDIFSKN